MNRRVPLFGFQIDAIDMAQAVDQVFAWMDHPCGQCRFVVTPNVDHAVLFQEHAGLRAAYANASLTLADGMPIVAAARLLGRPLPGRVPGSDLVPAVFEAAKDRKPLRVFLLGAGRGVADVAAKHIHERWKNVEVVGAYSPPLGFERDAEENQRILERINSQKPDLLLVGLGAPKQELWVNAHHHHIEASAALCIGATIDFLAGNKRRAPRWMRRVGLEWLHRMATEPRRLVRRYLRDAWLFPGLIFHEVTSSIGRRSRRTPASEV